MANSEDPDHQKQSDLGFALFPESGPSKHLGLSQYFYLMFQVPLDWLTC